MNTMILKLDGDTDQLPFNPTAPLLAVVQIKDYSDGGMEDTTREFITIWMSRGEILATRIGDAGVHFPEWVRHPDAPIMVLEDSKPATIARAIADFADDDLIASLEFWNRCSDKRYA